MRRIRNVVMLLLAAIVLVSFALAGCTRYAKEEQLTTLDESKAAVISAEAKVTELEKKKADLEAKLNEKKQELKDVQQEKEKVQAKL